MYIPMMRGNGFVKLHSACFTFSRFLCNHLEFDHKKRTTPGRGSQAKHILSLTKQCLLLDETMKLAENLISISF